jgi:HlyD family secretion protein
MWRKIGVIALIIIILAIVGGIVYQQVKGEGGFKLTIGSKKKASKDEEEKPSFEAAKIGNLTIVVDATGSTEPITDIEVKSEATGRITEFFVEEGDRVSEGDLICKLDQSNQKLVVQAGEIRLQQARLAYNEAQQATSLTSGSALENAMESARAHLDSAQEACDNAQVSYERIAELHVKGYATDAELDAARQAKVAAESALNAAQSSYDHALTQLESFRETSDDNAVEQARLGIAAAEVSLADAKKQLGDSVIKSPITGIILEKPLDIGDSVVSINNSYGGGNTIVRVADLTKIQVRTNVDEIDIGKINVSQAADIVVDTYFDREFKGVVTNVFPQGVMTGTGLVSFVVMIEVDNSEGLLLGNMTASVKIEAEVIEDVLLIPLSATRAGDKPDTNIVYVLEEDEDPFDPDAKAKEREVKLGDTDYYDVVVLEGLEESELVKVRGFKDRIQFG